MDVQERLLRVRVVFALPGSRLAEWLRAEDTGLAPEESAINALCCFACGRDGGGFRVFDQDSYGEAPA